MMPQPIARSGYPSIAALSINPGIDVMCQDREGDELESRKRSLILP
jgi:hypothetical protein